MVDVDLVRAVLDGNTAAFTTLVDRHAHACLRFATRMLGNTQDAEDVTQETFLRAYGALGRYDGRVAFRTWLMSILVNRCRTAAAAQRRRGSGVMVSESLPELSVPPDDAGLRDAIERSLATLDPAQREAFLLKHVEQLSYQEMTAITGASIPALKMRVQRACERLQVLLKEDLCD